VGRPAGRGEGWLPRQRPGVRGATPTSRRPRSGAWTPRGPSPRSTATRPASASVRTATACSSSAKSGTSARRAPRRPRPGCAPATCAAARPTRTGSRGSRSRAITARTSSWTTSSGCPPPRPPAAASTSGARP
jgi:hypothetical protein